MEDVRLGILFCDLHGFARLAVRLGQRMPDFVQEFYEAMGEEITGHGGTIVKYMGDAVLATFPEGSERQAVTAALAMRRAVKGLLARWSIASDCELEVAVTAGTVARGVVGHRSLRASDVLGEIVSEAAVLGHYRGVAITAQVRKAIGGSFATEPMGDTRLKWRTTPLPAWRVIEA